MPEQRIRLLAAGDEPFTLTLIRLALQKERFRIRHRAVSAPLPRNRDFDIVLLDLPESRRNGNLLWKRLRNAMPDIPLIVLHSLAGPEKVHLEQEIAWEKQLVLLDRSIMPEVLEKVILQLLAGVPRQLIESEFPERLFQPPVPDDFPACPWCTLDPAMLLSVFSLPVEKTGGDACEMIQLAFGRWLFFMGDLAGHGTAAAEPMRQVRLYLQELAHCGESGCKPHNLLNSLNAFFFRTFGPGKSMTCLVAVIDFPRCRICCQSAGHPPLVGYAPRSGQWFRPNGKEIADDIPVGWLSDHRYEESATSELTFPPDTVFFCLTDGLLERMNRERHSPSALLPPALLGTVRNAPGTAAFPFRLHQALDQLGYRTISDDITIAAFCKNELSPDELHFVIRPEQARPGDAVEEFVTLHTQEEELGFKAGLLVHEFIANILLHGLAPEEKHCSCTIYLYLKIEAESLRIEVLDRGCEWDRSLLQQKEFDFFRRRNGRMASSGRGIALIAQLASRITSTRYAGLNDTTFYLSRNVSKPKIKENRHER